MQSENDRLVRLRNRIERPRDWSATLLDPDGVPVCVRSVTAWNWEHALSEMKKFCQLDQSDRMTIAPSTLNEDQEPRDISEIGNNQTHYLGTARCSDSYAQATRSKPPPSN